MTDDDAWMVTARITSKAVYVKARSATQAVRLAVEKMTGKKPRAAVAFDGRRAEIPGVGSLQRGRGE